jgi:8-oxo-dGTP diphosphatase
MFPAFKGEDWYVFVFTVQEFSGELVENGEGFLQWIKDADLESLPLWPSDHIFLPWIRQGRFFSAKFVYAGEEMKDYTVSFYSL